MKENKYLKAIGARILSEANDLKRTIKSMSKELDVNYEYLQNVIKGQCKHKDTFKIIKKIGKTYPIDSSDLILINDDCKHATLHMTSKKSKATSRVFDRLNKKKDLTPYYDYRDTAMSKIAPFKPEWIKQLRVVKNSKPDNLNIAYNNGHFMHQMTFFIGCVNFYYELDGKKYCEEMNTGDSNYISPYLPHSFASRNKKEKAYIVAVTFGGDVRRSQKEMYALGENRVLKYKLDIKNKNKAISQLITQHMQNENLTKEMLKNNTSVNISNLLDETKIKTNKEIATIANILNIQNDDLMIPKYHKKHEIVVCKKNAVNSKLYPSKNYTKYKIYTLARANKLPNMKGFNIEILSNNINKDDMFDTSLHSYIYNYLKSKVEIVWIYNNKIYSKILKSGDSMYVQPFIKYGFQNKTGKKSAVFVARVGGSMNTCTQKELSYFGNTSRMVHENKCWFN